MKLWLVLNTTQYFVLQSQASKKSKWNNNRNQEEEDWEHNTETWIERTLAQHHRRHTASAARLPTRPPATAASDQPVLKGAKLHTQLKIESHSPRYWIPIFVSFVPSGLFLTQHPRHDVWQLIGTTLWLNRRLLFENKPVHEPIFVHNSSIQSPWQSLGFIHFLGSKWKYLIVIPHVHPPHSHPLLCCKVLKWRISKMGCHGKHTY